MAFSTESTRFTRDVLGRYSCSTWEEATSDPFGIDVVVLGAGMYGSYCASKIYQLSKQRFGNGDRFRALRVLVLEAGPYVLPEHGQNIPDLGLFDPGVTNVSSGAEIETRREVWGVGWRSNQPFVGQAYCVGGKGLFWGGWCPRLQSKDLAKWPAEVAEYLTVVNTNTPTGFRPIAHLDLATNQTLKRGDPLTGYEAIEYELGVLPVDDFVFDPVQLSGGSTKAVGLNESIRVFIDKLKATIDPNILSILPSPIAVQTQSYISGLFALDKYSSLPALTSAVRDDHSDGRESNLRISVVPNCHVSSIGFQSHGEAPERGTRVIDRINVRVDGADRTLRIAPHCQVVLAMSAIESTRLALESFSLVGSGLRAPGDELMGRNFMVHLRFDISFDIDRDAFAKWVKSNWPGTTLADQLQLASAHIQCDGHFGRYQYQLFAATNENGPDANMYKMVPDLDIQKRIADGFQSGKIRFVLRASGEVEGGRNSRLDDNRFDYIDLAGDADYDKQFGHRRAWVQFNRGDHAQAGIWKEMHDTAHAIARALNGGTPPDYRGGDFSLDAVKRQQGVGTTFHDAGTLWMGDHPESSVTDANGHFHHVTNAYCCDQALFTTIGSANPVLTGIALARKIADDIVTRHDEFNGQRVLTGLTSKSLLPLSGWLQSPYAGMNVIATDNSGLLETNPFAGIGLYYLPVEFGDFEMSIDWKAYRTYNNQEVSANSGILLRTPNPATVDFSNRSQFDAFYSATTEIQIDETGKQFFDDTGRATFGNSWYKTGAVYGVTAAKQWAAKVAAPDGNGLNNRYWNTFEISAVGPRIRVWLNGKPVCDTNVPGNKRMKGFIGMQLHTGRVQFRNLKMK